MLRSFFTYHMVWIWGISNLLFLFFSGSTLVISTSSILSLLISFLFLLNIVIVWMNFVLWSLSLNVFLIAFYLHMLSFLMIQTCYWNRAAFSLAYSKVGSSLTSPFICSSFIAFSSLLILFSKSAKLTLLYVEIGFFRAFSFSWIPIKRKIFHSCLINSTKPRCRSIYQNS